MTSLIAKLGYVGVTTPRFEEMRTWGPGVLGCMLGPAGADGAVRLKIDDADYRLSFHPGDEYKMAYAGWEVLSHRDLDAASAATCGDTSPACSRSTSSSPSSLTDTTLMARQEAHREPRAGQPSRPEETR